MPDVRSHVSQGSHEQDPPIRAQARLHPTRGNDVHGIVTLESINGQVHVTGRVEGLPPGQRGFHIHEYGDCSAPDASSAGEHFDPYGTPHGGPKDPPEERHAGDFGNLEARPDGVAIIDKQGTSDLLTPGAKGYAVGRAFIVHDDKDDLHTQPTGDAGARLACGVIGILAPETP